MNRVRCWVSRCVQNRLNLWRDMTETQTAQWDAQVARTEDLSGLRCPMPILRTKKALAQMQAREILKVTTTDPAAVDDLVVFCKQTGHVLLAQLPSDDGMSVRHWIARKQ
ncbi:MAG: tusA [Burkholderiaceae bacterium]|nr:tusA [Burkholderiaceae bacterium]